MADRRKLAQGLMMMTPAMREDLAGREQDIQRGKTVELLRRAGKEMYENPIVNTAIGFTPGVGDVQAAGETFAALQRGAPWQETAGYAVGMLPFVPALRTTWHGSPHGFTKFDVSKIGTGEGAQAYGHGLYLAEARPTAESYMRTQLNNAPELEKMALNAGVSPDAANTLAQWYHNTKDKSKLDDFMETMRAEAPNPYIQKFRESVLAEEPAINKAWESFNAPGYLYKVDLPDEQIAKMLDWDKPLSEQAPEVQQAFRNTDFYKQAQDFYGQNKQWYNDPEQKTGKSLYQYMQGGVGDDITQGGMSPAEASAYLRQAGIPGIQYLDQASRGAGEGTRNYVVFSDEIPQILERNGQPIAQALREYAPKIDEATGLPLNEQGMVTVYHHTNPEAAKQIAETGRLRSAGEPDVYVTSWDKPDTGYGESVVPIQVDPSVLRLDDEFPSGRMDFAIPVGKSGEFIFKGNK